MSTVTVKMCDIAYCRREAREHLDTMLVCRQDGENGDGSYKIFTEENVDLCFIHELQYRRALPDMTIERKVTATV